MCIRDRSNTLSYKTDSGLGRENFLYGLCSTISVNFHIYYMHVHEGCRDLQGCRCDIDLREHTHYVRPMMGRKFHRVKYNCINRSLLYIVGVGCPPCNSYPHFLYPEFPVYRGDNPAKPCSVAGDNPYKVTAQSLIVITGRIKGETCKRMTLAALPDCLYSGFL